MNLKWMMANVPDVLVVGRKKVDYLNKKRKQPLKNKLQN